MRGSLSGDSSILSSDGAVVYGGDHHPSHVVVHNEEEEDGASSSSTLNESQLMEDFDSQIPDFGAVPLTFPPPNAAAHRAHSDLTTDTSILPVTQESSTSSNEHNSQESTTIQTAAATIISSLSTTAARRSASITTTDQQAPMEVELVSMVPEPDDIPIVPATILYSWFSAVVLSNQQI